MSVAAPLSIALPFAGALAALIFWRRGAAAAIAMAVVSLQLALVVALLLGVWVDGAVRYQIGGWGAPLGIELHIDGLAAVMGVLTAGVAIPVSVYAMSHLRTRRSGDAATDLVFWPSWLFLLASLQALYLSADTFNLYVTLELLTLASVALVISSDTAEARRAALRYLMAAFLGSMAFLLAVALLYGEAGALDLRVIGSRLAPGPVAWAAVALAFTGLALKSALFPLHFWLPGAHSSAPAPVSAMLSGFVVAGAFYILLRLWFESFAGIITFPAAQLAGVLGSVAVIWGSVQAIRQQRLKVMIAYSTVAQVGYFFLIFPLAQRVDGVEAPWAAAAWEGGIYLIVSHACAKAAMFLAAGTIAHALGHDRIVGISGIASRLPISTYAFGIAGMSLIGLPPSGGFVGKWLLLSASLSSGQWWWALVIVVGGVLTAGYVFLVLGQELSESRSDVEAPLQRVPRSLEYTAFILALAALLLGVRAIEPLELLRAGSPFMGLPVMSP
jgi:multicomponent Na+:H+ antiporter subunit D